jgi:hypothetical protein
MLPALFLPFCHDPMPVIINGKFNLGGFGFRQVPPAGVKQSSFTSRESTGEFRKQQVLRL